MKILSLNTGSSTVKYRLFDADRLEPVARGLASRIGEADGRVEHDGSPGLPRPRVLPLADHRTALEELLGDVVAAHDDTGIAAVGHRVVHGGERFTGPVRIDAAVLATIRDLGRLAPLHNPTNAMGVEVARALLPESEQVAVFDTAFHARMPMHAHRYALPVKYAQRGFRRYGFHGISHASVAAAAAAHLDRSLAELRLITLHLGSGASAAAIRGGVSVDTSMGMTPLEGLVMGTRGGDLDPGAIVQLFGREELSVAEVEALLNRESGLRALAGTGDMRDIETRAATGEPRAEEALAVYCYRVKKYIGAYFAALGGIDALVFTGGIGENSAGVRSRCCAGLAALGIALEESANQANGTAIHSAAVPVLVIPTDEERAIARATLELLGEDPVQGATT